MNEKTKSKNRFELDPERLATTDESGNRVYLYPEDVEGKWKNRRHIFYWFLIILYLVLPWIYINGRPALMLNIFTREFTFFGSIYYGIEPLLIFLIVAAGLFLIAFFTSVYGRVWCGWACPQTVFIQSLFMKIERLVEGPARTRKALDESGFSWEKLIKRSVKWTIFTIISLHIAHTFIGYIVGPRELLQMSLHSPMENLGLFIATMISTTIILLDFGWFREQFCIIACPYGRMQSVIMDNDSLVVAYDVKRGEPRRGTNPADVPEGDCINCYHCVKVCPTGIDIRRGTQMECIACTLCIDACDDIMIKVKRPTGLIRYSSENKMNGVKNKNSYLRPAFYFLIFVVLIAVFVAIIQKKQNIDMVFMRSRGAPYFVTNDGVRNHFTLKFSHQGDEQFDLELRVKDPALKDKIKLVTPAHPVKIRKAETKIILFVHFPSSLLTSGSLPLKIEAVDQSNKVVAEKEVMLVGPTSK